MILEVRIIIKFAGVGRREVLIKRWHEGGYWDTGKVLFLNCKLVMQVCLFNEKTWLVHFSVYVCYNLNIYLINK